MTSTWNRSLKSWLFTDRRPLPGHIQSHPIWTPTPKMFTPVYFLQSLLVLTAVTFTGHTIKEASPPTKKTKPPPYFFKPLSESNPRPPALTDPFCPLFTHLRWSPLITKQADQRHPCWKNPSPIKFFPRVLFHRSRKKGHTHLYRLPSSTNELNQSKLIFPTLPDSLSRNPVSLSSFLEQTRSRERTHRPKRTLRSDTMLGISLPFAPDKHTHSNYQKSTLMYYFMIYILLAKYGKLITIQLPTHYSIYLY